MSSLVPVFDVVSFVSIVPLTDSVPLLRVSVLVVSLWVAFVVLLPVFLILPTVSPDVFIVLSVRLVEPNRHTFQPTPPSLLATNVVNLERILGPNSRSCHASKSSC